MSRAADTGSKNSFNAANTSGSCWFAVEIMTFIRMATVGASAPAPKLALTDANASRLATAVAESDAEADAEAVADAVAVAFAVAFAVAAALSDAHICGARLATALSAPS